MSEVNLDRVREDLAVMKQAVGVRQPYERDLVGHSLSIAALGAVIAFISASTSLAAPPIVRGSPAHLAYTAAIVLPALVFVAISTVVSYRRRSAAPLLWRENRQSIGVVAVVAPLYAAFVAWTSWLGVSGGAITVATLFLFGLFMLATSLADPSRRHWLGWSIATMLAGACAPLLSYQTSGILIGGWLLAGGLSTVAIVAGTLRQEGNRDGHRL